MTTIKIIKDGEYAKDEIKTVPNNVAHRLIESKQAILYTNKMMSPYGNTRSKRSYNIKRG